MGYSRPLKNLVAVFSGSILAKFFGLILAIILARYLGPEEYGKYAFALSFTYIFTVIADFGLNDLFVRDIARDRTTVNKYIAFAIIIKPLLSISSIVCLIVALKIINYSNEIILITIVYSLHIIFITLINSFTAIFRSYEKLEYAALIGILNGLIALVLISFVIIFDGTLIQILIFRVITFFLGALISIFLLLKIIAKPDFSIDLDYIKHHAKKALPFLTIGLIHTLYFNIDIIMLSKMKGDIYVGWYTPAANDLFFAILIIPSGIATVIYPMFSRYYSESIEKLREAMNFSTKILIILGIPIGFGTIILAENIINLIFGDQFSNSIVVLQIMAFAICFSFIREPYGFGLAAVGKEKILMWINIISLTLNVLLNLLLIPIYSHVGAAFTTALCILISLVISFYFTNKEIEKLSIID